MPVLEALLEGAARRAIVGLGRVLVDDVGGSVVMVITVVMETPLSSASMAASTPSTGGLDPPPAGRVSKAPVALAPAPVVTTEVAPAASAASN